MIVFDDVVRELAELNKLLQRNLTPIEAFQFVKARISKLRLQYLGDIAHWSDEVCEFMQSNPDIDMAPILRFVERLCLHLDSRFPDNELKEWNIFEVAALTNVTSFNFGETAIVNLIAKYQHFFEDSEEACKMCIVDYPDFRCLVSEKFKSGLMQTFHDVLQFALKDGQFALLTRLLDICGTFQASSADCERGFSLMNAVKTKSRNRLLADHLDMSIRIKFHLLAGKKIDLDSVYCYWSSHKDRREKL